MRWTDEGAIESTRPSRFRLRASSAHVHVDSERPMVSGSSQASLTRCVVTSGGKTGWAPGSRSIFQTGQPACLKAATPFADNATLQTQLHRHLTKIDPVGQQQDEAGTLDKSKATSVRAGGDQ